MCVWFNEILSERAFLRIRCRRTEGGEGKLLDYLLADVKNAFVCSLEGKVEEIGKRKKKGDKKT